MQILVFKTDARNKRRVNSLGQHLQHIKGIIRWNVDLQDVDNVLRIEAVSLAAGVVEKNLQQAGYYCEELQ
ncbi:MAG: hypothetical protein QM726_25950 [Chitinophagaceae bacterium]